MVAINPSNRTSTTMPGLIHRLRVRLLFMAEMTERSLPHEQLLVVTALLAGFSFTALMLMMQSPGPFHAMVWPGYADTYFVLLVSILAIVSIDLIGCSMGMAMAAAGQDPYGRLWTFNGATFYIGLFGLMLFIPLLILPLSLISALVVVVFEILLVVSFRRRAPKVPFRSPYVKPSS